MRHPLIYVPNYYEQKEPFELGHRIKVGPCKFKIEVVRDHGRVVEKPFGDLWIPNLITNNGLDQLCQGTSMYGFFNISYFLYGARIGTGTTPPAITDTALTALTQSTQTNFTGGTCSSSYDTTNGAATTTRILEFAAVGATVGINEVGLSNAGTSGTAICTHALLPSTVTLNNGDNMRLTYTVTESIPCTINPITVSLAAVNGFNISGQIKVTGTFAQIFGQINADGSAAGANCASFLHYGGSNTLPFMCSTPSTFPAVNTAPTAPTNIAQASSESYSTYTVGSYVRNHQMIWVPSNPSGTVTNVQAFVWCEANSLGSPSANACVMLILSAQQTKANTNTLAINDQLSVARA